jgi:hypothetical protein
MAAESEMQESVNALGARLGKIYHAVMGDGSVAAVGREAIKDVRDTLDQVFFGQGNRAQEPGTPFNPYYSDIAEDRASHMAAVAANDNTQGGITPSDLAEGKSAGGVQEPSRNQDGHTPSPGDLAEGKGVSQSAGHDQQEHQRQREGRGR